MSALGELKEKMATNQYMTNIETAIFNSIAYFPITANEAAEELAQLHVEIELRRVVLAGALDVIAAKDEALSKALMALEVVRKSYPNMVHEVLHFVDAALKATP